MQWQGMDWPVLVDALDLLGVSAVPLSFLIDESGVIQSVGPTPETLETFLERPAPPRRDAVEAPAVEDPPATLSNDDGVSSVHPPGKRDSRDSANWLLHGDGSFLDGELDEAVRAYTKSLALDGPPEAWFRRGVALRRRHELPGGKPFDFRRALESWGEALRLRPNQYIWRRRIQQYGPRLDKPYSFYDWVSRARTEIEARGETPWPLPVEPGGAELARPATQFSVADPTAAPDPEGRVVRDSKRLITIETAVAPAVVSPGRAARLHLVLRPQRVRGAHWNNEAGPTRVWLGTVPGCTLERRQLVAAVGRGELSEESRILECEVRLSETAPTGELAIPAYALYYVCDDADGVCQFLRQDFEVRLRVLSD